MTELQQEQQHELRRVLHESRSGHEREVLKMRLNAYQSLMALLKPLSLDGRAAPTDHEAAQIAYQLTDWYADSMGGLSLEQGISRPTPYSPCLLAGRTSRRRAAQEDEYPPRRDASKLRTQLTRDVLSRGLPFQEAGSQERRATQRLTCLSVQTACAPQRHPRHRAAGDRASFRRVSGFLSTRTCRSTDVSGAGLLRVRRRRCRCVASGEGGPACTRGRAVSKTLRPRRFIHAGKEAGLGSSLVRTGRCRARVFRLTCNTSSARRPFHPSPDGDVDAPSGPGMAAARGRAQGPVDHRGAGVGSRALVSSLLVQLAESAIHEIDE